MDSDMGLAMDVSNIIIGTLDNYINLRYIIHSICIRLQVYVEDRTFVNLSNVLIVYHYATKYNWYCRIHLRSCWSFYCRNPIHDWLWLKAIAEEGLFIDMKLENDNGHQTSALFFLFLGATVPSHWIIYNLHRSATQTRQVSSIYKS